MTEQFRQNNPAAQQQSDSDMFALIKRMQQQLSFLEKKIDILIGQLQDRPFKGKPYPAKREYRENPGERNFDRGRRFEKRHDDENKGFDRTKKPFYYKGKHRGR